MLFKNKLKQVIFCLKVLLVLSIVTGIFMQFPIFQKKITVSIDGVQQEFTLKGLYVDDLVDALNQQYGIDNYRFSPDFNVAHFLGDIQSIHVATKKEIKIKGTNGERTFTTFAATLQDLLREINFVHTVDRADVLGQLVQTNMTLEERVVEENYEVEVIDNPDLAEGVEHVVQEGHNKVISQLFSVINQQGMKLGDAILNAGTKKIIEKGTKIPEDSIWDRLAFCESGGRWNINTGNGYYGGIQFSAPTWRTASRAVGLNIPYAHQATREQQIMAGKWLQKRSGWGQWPSCARRLGLI